MRRPRIPRLLGLKNFLNNCFAHRCISILFPNIRGTHILQLLGFKNYLNNFFAYCYTSMLFPNIRETRIPQLLGFTNYLNNSFIYCCTSLQAVESLASRTYQQGEGYPLPARTGRCACTIPQGSYSKKSLDLDYRANPGCQGPFRQTVWLQISQH